jgi:dsDNA-specific endonuclease/ATPase MutS2
VRRKRAQERIEDQKRNINRRKAKLKEAEKMQEAERMELEKVRHDEYKAELRGELDKYFANLKDREMPLFIEALDKVNELVPKLEGSHFDLTKKLRLAVYRAMQDLRTFSNEIQSLEQSLKKN